jgi:hypothetical protein
MRHSEYRRMDKVQKPSDSECYTEQAEQQAEGNLLGAFLGNEDGHNTLPSNVGEPLSDYMASYPRSCSEPL